VKNIKKNNTIKELENEYEEEEQQTSNKKSKV